MWYCRQWRWLSRILSSITVGYWSVGHKNGNLGKCEMVHLGKSNEGRTFTEKSQILGKVVKQSDLGVQVHSLLTGVLQVDG